MAERIAARDPSNGIEGLTFVLAGKLAAWPKVWNSRTEVKEYLESYSAILGSSVTKKTDYLVTNERDSGSEKNKKAEEYGVLVINEEDFNEMIGKRFRNVAQITIPNWLKVIPQKGFMGCKKLKSINVPEGVTKICEEAFAYCEALENVSLPATLSCVEPRAFYQCGEIHFTAQCEYPLKLIQEQRFQVKNSILTKYNGPGWNIEIPEGITAINDLVFQNSAVKTVTIPGSVKNIPVWAFKECRKLTDVTINEGVNQIKQFAFEECENLEKVSIPTSMKLIDCWAFIGCKKLTNVVIPSNVEKVGISAFSGCKGLVSVIICEGVREIGDWAFTECKNLTGISIPASTVSIGKEVFNGCPNLTIHTSAGSYAEQYAKENNIPFVTEEA